MKKTTKKCSDLLPKRVVDEEAETIAELRASTPLGRGSLYAFVQQQVAAGHWEQVWKRHPKKGMVPAYRVKQ